MADRLKNVWHKRYHGDALNGYMGLTLEQRGAYTTLLDLMYDSDWSAGIPDRDRWIAGHLNVSVRRWKGLREELIGAGKIDIFEGLISNVRYRKERENSASLSRKRAESGASGGEKSGEKRKKANDINTREEASASVLPLYACAIEAELESEEEEKDRLKQQHSTTGGREIVVAEPVVWDAVELASHLSRIGGVRNVEPARIMANIKAVREWTSAGADPPLIENIITSARDRSDKPIHSLAYFGPAILQAVAKRDHPSHDKPTGYATEIRDPLLRDYLERGAVVRSGPAF